MNKIGITLATAAALLTVIALVMQLSEPVSAQQQQQTTTGTIHSFCSTRVQHSLYKILYQVMNHIKL